MISAENKITIKRALNSPDEASLKERLCHKNEDVKQESVQDLADMTGLSLLFIQQNLKEIQNWC